MRADSSAVQESGYPDTGGSPGWRVDNGFIDFLSNGFKMRLDDGPLGARYMDDDELYLYMAIAETPFVTSKGVPTTAN